MQRVRIELSPTEIGLNQERLIKKVIADVGATQLGFGYTTSSPSQNVRETKTWQTDYGPCTVNWYRPNTHPPAIGEVHTPDFDFWVNGQRLVNLESKNWQPGKYPLSLHQVEEKIISRVSGRPVLLGNVLVIGDLLCQEGDEQRILELLQQYRFRVILTGRQAVSPEDETSYSIIRARLEPLLVDLFMLRWTMPN
ncbi:MAG: hypothetical protein ABSD99_07240 [Candidatus Bathyarchaeia archaeon]